MSRLPIEKVPSTEDRTLPIFAEIEDVAKRIRDRAFDLFAGRGFTAGHDLGDWLRAEREICWPEAELAEEPDEYMVKVALAGFDPDDIAVTATPREIIVKAKHEFERKEPNKDDDDTMIRWSEFRSDDVFRRVELPGDANVEKISAEFRRGLLQIKAPKAMDQAPQEKKVTISTAA